MFLHEPAEILRSGAGTVPQGRGRNRAEPPTVGLDSHQRGDHRESRAHASHPGGLQQQIDQRLVVRAGNKQVARIPGQDRVQNDDQGAAFPGGEQRQAAADLLEHLCMEPEEQAFHDLLFLAEHFGEQRMVNAARERINTAVSPAEIAQQDQFALEGGGAKGLFHPIQAGGGQRVAVIGTEQVTEFRGHQFARARHERPLHRPDQVPGLVR